MLFALALAVLWGLVFYTTGLMWWNAPFPYEKRLPPPSPVHLDLPTFEGVDPALQSLRETPVLTPSAGQDARQQSQ